MENRTTDAKRQITTGPDGRYLVDGLLSATYTVTGSVQGFADAVVSDLPLSVGQERTVDLHLQPESVKESVTVSSGGLAEVDTSSASLGANVSSREVDSLPINGRMISQLYLLIPVRPPPAREPLTISGSPGVRMNRTPSATTASRAGASSTPIRPT